MENQPKKKQIARRCTWTSPLVPHLSFTCSHTLSRAALSCLCNSIAAPASVPDTQALLSNTTPRITCSRLPVSHTCTHTQWVTPPCPFPDPISTRRTWRFYWANSEPQTRAGRMRRTQISLEVRWRQMLLASRVLMKHGNNFLIALRITCLRILKGKTSSTFQ